MKYCRRNDEALAGIRDMMRTAVRHDPKSVRRRAATAEALEALHDIEERTFGSEQHTATARLEELSSRVIWDPTKPTIDDETLRMVCPLTQQMAQRNWYVLDYFKIRLNGIFRPVAGMSMADIDGLHHSEFERLVADLMDRDGYRVVRSCGGAGDQGADVLAMDDKGRYRMIQCKHHRNGSASVGQPVVQHLYGGARATERPTLPIVVTNARFTSSARRWARENDKVRLVDREILKRWAEDGACPAAVVAL
ncbi:restriction endonuclease [Streptomyces platensis]|uniref:restriction endonuclease n=1 Tax=Streptomyces platensis TaxID=58346 RepID=UPI0030E53D44